MNLKENYQTIVAFCCAVGLILAGMSYFAKASELRMVELRLDQKIVFDQVMNVENQMFAIEERNKSCKEINEWEERDRKQYKELKSNLEMLKKRQDAIMRK